MYIDKASFYVENITEEEADAIVDYFDDELRANAGLERTGKGFSICFECDDLSDLRDYEDILDPYIFNGNDFNFADFKADYLEDLED